MPHYGVAFFTEPNRSDLSTKKTRKQASRVGQGNTVVNRVISWVFEALLLRAAH